MKALIIGATGATGKALTQQLLLDADYTEVVIFVRRPVALTHEKLTVHIVDFDKPEIWADSVRGDVLYSCLGTTLKQAGSRPNQWKIDHDYPLAAAQTARRNAVPYHVLISSDHANPDSRLFYYRMKGKLEQEVTELDFPQSVIVRPPLLKRPNTDRTGERITEILLENANKIGLFKSARPMPTETLATAMRQAVKLGKSGIIGKQALWRLADITNH
ncbi:NAD(P)H-binding protein [Neisseria sp.]|uniref:NAD(P)H-binding protein n=1 Tax=Neisseria sp. TaxID=192066 RepID=UPI0035A0FA50